ncbi:methyl-accepting chemotaxis protein [Rhodothalassium salexigens]|uniref:methyl-accepting chemotaxis protein n=1 Tax=Rhodothalassium salexigens TaxID=1086 RepID=UPI001913DA7E
MKVSVVSSLLILATALGVAVTAYRLTVGSVAEQAQSRQTMSLNIAAEVLANAQPGITIRYRDEVVTQIVADQLGPVSDHRLIDRISQATGETATIFLWQDDRSAFVRRSTSIRRDDGSRVIGTVLDPDGPVLPVVSAGRTYRGEADVLGRIYYGLYQPIESSQGAVIGLLYVGVEKQQIADVLTALRNRVSLAALVSVLIAGGLIWWLMRASIGPVQPISETIARLSDNDLDVTVPAMDRHDEIGVMARAVDVLRDKMAERQALQARQAEAEREQQRREAEQAERDRQAEHQRQEEERAREQRMQEQRKADMARLAGEFERNVGELINNVAHMSEEMEATARTLSQNVADTSSQTKMLMTGAEGANSAAQAVATATEEMSAAISEVSSNVHASSEVAQQTNGNAQNAGRDLDELVANIRTINSIVDGINEVADQTNLLALNATIEAARAGEAGKGFAVVASEVKALATQTQKMTDDISAQLSAIQSRADQSVGSMKTILGLVDRLEASSTEVASSIEQQVAAVQEISGSAQRAAASSDEITQGIGGVEEASRNISAASSQMTTAAQGLAQTAENLSGAMQSFLVTLK